MINATTFQPGVGLTYQCSPADVSEAARTVVAPASSSRSGERLKSVSDNGKSTKPLKAKPTALATLVSLVFPSFEMANVSNTRQSGASNPQPVEPLPFPATDSDDRSLCLCLPNQPGHFSTRRLIRYREALELAINDPKTPFAVQCQLGIRLRAFSKVKRVGAVERSEAASRADALSVPHGNHGDNNFPTTSCVCEGKL